MSTTPVGSRAIGSVADDASPATAAGTPLSRQAGAVLVTLGALLGAGILVGVVWSLIAPTVPCTVLDDASCQYSFEAGQFFIAEGTFGVLAAACGVLAARGARAWLRQFGWPIVLALAVGGLLASLVAWRVGVWLGPDDAAAVTAAVGSQAELPLRLRASGLLLVWSIASVFVVLWSTALADDLALSEDHLRSPA